MYCVQEEAGVHRFVVTPELIHIVERRTNQFRLQHVSVVHVSDDDAVISPKVRQAGCTPHVEEEFNKSFFFHPRINISSSDSELFDLL